MKIIDREQVQKALSFPILIAALQRGFASEHAMPKRSVFELDPRADNHDAFAVLPAWNDSVIGVKAFTYFPDNEAQGKASLYSKIMLFDREHGVPLALVDGTQVTLWRTAAVSALAASYLAREDAKHLIMFGAGKLAPYMVRAHLAVRDYDKVTLIARNPDKAASLQASLVTMFPEVRFELGQSRAEVIGAADVICTATGSHKPLFDGRWLKAGTHIDLIGNHHKNAREIDTATLLASRVFVDSKANVLNEAGELLIPMEQGVFKAEQIEAELADMARENRYLRSHNSEITLFKSVGTALSDLVAAKLVMDHH
ncbi:MULTISPECIES: ornithine cyclodeaminase family protein [unclassified Pseudoalteromonas]|uniref:ornithine cyclodeaminase family protein n=1 Tax=unclassified Pseudoalteromonas TaxID=194690 RepID=UPI0020980ED7|nr:ornithine cyclodeaminase family protein [Pseudoalteromonas sp. XMcav2-N]MCO7187153.1 ornithine cyclodeaminase family protein [Pseudoalteromonas sp. XMcav2-N]